MEAVPLRINPGEDLRQALETAVTSHNCEAAFVLSGIGSLAAAQLRFAGAPQTKALEGDLEILTLAGTICADGSHLHMSVSNAQGDVFGGHVGHGCIVRTTAEVLLVLMPDWSFTRKLDPTTGYAELVVRSKR